MALPATFDIYYYRGDTYTFYLNVKDANGTPIDLESEYTGLFTISNYRGPEDLVNIGAKVSYEGVVTIDGSQIICTITPTTGALLTSPPYVYDIQVKDTSGDNVYTYVTGNIYVTLDVSEAD